MLNPNIHWSTLSATQREVGIAPNLLSELVFDIAPENWTADKQLQVSNFFAGCLLAASPKEFQDHIWSLISSPHLPEPVRAIAEKVQKVSPLQEMTILKDGEGAYQCPHFEGVGYGFEYRAYKEKFGSSYNRFVSENLAHFMHPARMDDLLRSGIIEQEDSQLAERLISYRCYGSLGFQIAEYERAISQHQREVAELTEQLSQLLEPAYVEKLEENDLILIRHERCRKYVRRIFNQLSSQNKLDLLNLPVDELYRYTGSKGAGGPVHPELEQWAIKYTKKAGIGELHFGAVVKDLKPLANRDLNASKRQCLTERMNCIKSSIEFLEGQLDGVKKNWMNSLSQLSRGSEDYRPGDFSFCDEMTKRILTNMYQAVEKLEAWSFFDLTPPENKGYVFWGHPMVNEIASHLDSDGHTGYSMAFCFRWMQNIHRTGWNNVVKKVLADSTSSLGMVELMRAKINEIEIEDPESDEIPKQFLCPITQELMKEPVIASDGNTYERSTLVKWLQINPISPITRQRMPNTEFMPNHKLFFEIQGWIKAHQSNMEISNE